MSIDIDELIQRLRGNTAHQAIYAEVAADVIHRLRFENESLQADAVRYRWLRKRPRDVKTGIDIVERVHDANLGVRYNLPLREERADIAIDEAMRAEDGK